MEIKDTCVKVSGTRSHIVSKQKPVPVTVYDYYDQSEFAARSCPKFNQIKKIKF